jgi:hypothetical protein
VMHSSLIRFLALLLLIGCRSVPLAGRSACVPSSERHSGAIAMDALMRLPGRYTFVTVATSPGLDKWTVQGELTLRAADTLERYYERRIRGIVRAGNRPLVGQLVWHSEGKVRTEPVVVQQNPGDTQLISGFCTECDDATLVYHRIIETRANGFSGRWNDPQTGIVRLIDKNGRELPDPEGYFCAFRVL